MSYANFSNILDPEILLDKGIVSKWGEPNADEEVDEEVANEAKIDDTRQTEWHHEVPLWGHIVPNPIDGEVEVGSHDNSSERADCDLADQAVGKLAHDERVGGEAEGGQDGEGQHHRHQHV